DSLLQAGNSCQGEFPLKGILPDHRSVLTDPKIYIKMDVVVPDSSRDVFHNSDVCYHDPEKCEHVGPKVTTSHGSNTTTRMIWRFTVDDDLKENSKITQGLLEYYEDEGAMNRRNNAMAGVGDGNRNVVNRPDIGHEFDEPNHNGLIDKMRWLKDLFGLPLLLEELDAMRTVGEDELLSNVASAEKGKRGTNEIWESF
ncbi:hypothetical protein Tco_1431260, partial [Tanacetum coccineum]